MDAFYLITSTIAVIFLILILTYMGIKIRNSNTKTTFPPQANLCPDLWKTDETSGNCIIPSTIDTTKSIFTTGLYGKAGSTIDFTDNRWNNGARSSICNKSVWANNNSISWDGITNYNGC